MTIDQSVEKPLRILAIVNLPWDARLGAARVWIELAAQWTGTGHLVEKFCLTDAFPNPVSRQWIVALQRALFPYRAAQFVRRNASRFDVIDSLIGTLPFSKKSLRFSGLVVARSVGLHRLYDQFHRESLSRWPDQPQGSLSGRVFYTRAMRRLSKAAERALRHCDLINLLNEDELKSLEHKPFARNKLMVQPNGLSHQSSDLLQQAMKPASIRLRHKKISFVGMWSLRKGLRDWPEIVRRVWEEIPDVNFTFLGTMTARQTILRDLALEESARVQCVEEYDPAELPGLLADCTIGLFPSYIEGFGLAVLEQLACGIPTVAYDVPGPRQILGSVRAMLLTPEGDAKAMADRAVRILRMSVAEYEALSAQCRSISAQFSWERIASDTTRLYRAALEDLRGRQTGIGSF